MSFQPTAEEKEDYQIAKQFEGKVFDRRYKVGDLIGIGGMSYVFRGYDQKMERDVAMKLLMKQYSDNAEALARFENEIKAIIRIDNHPNVITVYDRGKFPHEKTNWFYIVMEYLAGPTLGDQLRYAPFTLKETEVYISQILAGLQAAHNVNVVHRDLKSENVKIVDKSRQPPRIKILDFGISKLQSMDSSEDSIRTRVGQIFGTPYYMSPEQALGDVRRIDHRTDIYAAGVLHFYMLTGRLPFDDPSDNPSLIMKMHISDEPPVPSSVNPEIPPEIDEIVLRALEKEPEKRWSSAYDYSRAFYRAVHGDDVARPRVTIPPEVRQPTNGSIRPPTAEAQTAPTLVSGEHATIDAQEYMSKPPPAVDFKKSSDDKITDRIHKGMWAAVVILLLICSVVIAAIYWPRGSADKPELPAPHADFVPSEGPKGFTLSEKQIEAVSPKKVAEPEIKKPVKVETFSEPKPVNVETAPKPEVVVEKELTGVALTAWEATEKYRYTKNCDRVINMLRELAKNHPNNPDVNYALGDCFYRQKNPFLAKKFLSKALELDPGHPKAKWAVKIVY